MSDPAVGPECPKVLVSGDDVRCAARHGTLEDSVVGRITADDREALSDPHTLDERQHLIEEPANLFGRETELRIGEDPQVFLQDRPGDQEVQST